MIDASLALPEPPPPLRLIDDARVSPSLHAAVLRRAGDPSAYGRVVVESAPPLRLLQSARAFVIASEQESFCRPLVEAQAYGVSAVARETGVLRETGGPGNTYVGGSDPRAYAAAIERLSIDAAARSVLLEHAAGYGWNRTSALARLLAQRDLP